MSRGRVKTPSFFNAGMFFLGRLCSMASASSSAAIPESSMPVAEFLRKRMTTNLCEQYGTCLSIVEQTFEKHLGKQFHFRPEPSKVNTLFLFVGDLLYSLHRRKSMVCFLRFDELLSTIETLPPEIRVPLRNMWSLMRRAEPELVKANQRLLKMRTSSIRLLNLTAKGIDSVFGKLPSALADFAASEAHQFLGADKRLVIYAADKLISEIQEPGLAEIQRRLGPSIGKSE